MLYRLYDGLGYTKPFVFKGKIIKDTDQLQE